MVLTGWNETHRNVHILRLIFLKIFYFRWVLSFILLVVVRIPHCWSTNAQMLKMVNVITSSLFCWCFVSKQAKENLKKHPSWASLSFYDLNYISGYSSTGILVNKWLCQDIKIILLLIKTPSLCYTQQ